VRAGACAAEIIDKVDADLAIVDVVARVDRVTSTFLAAMADESVDRVLDNLGSDLLAGLEVLREDADAAVAMIGTVSATGTLMTSDLLPVAEDDVVG
jgi:hypothetical protein